MKRILSLFVFVLVLCLSVVPALAAEEGDTSSGAEIVPAASAGDPVSVNTVMYSGSVTRSSLVAVLEQIFGEYNPRTYSVTTYLNDGTAVSSVEYVPGLAGLDWAWISGVGIFSLALYCIFRMIGGLFKWK